MGDQTATPEFDPFLSQGYRDAVRTIADCRSSEAELCSALSGFSDPISQLAHNVRAAYAIGRGIGKAEIDQTA